MKKRTTSNGSNWEKICREICCLKLAQLIKSANRLHIFGIRSFDNTKYFKIDKWISLREICIAIGHLPIQPFPLLPYWDLKRLRAIPPPPTFWLLLQISGCCWLTQKLGPTFTQQSQSPIQPQELKMTTPDIGDSVGSLLEEVFNIMNWRGGSADSRFLFFTPSRILLNNLCLLRFAGTTASWGI